MLKKQKKNKTSFFKKIINFISDNATQVIETFLLLAVVSLPFFIDFESIFSKYLQENYPTPDNAVQYFLIQSGRTIIAIVLLLIVLLRIRKHIYYEYYANGSYCFSIVDKDQERHFESLLECLAWATSHYESDDNIDRPLNIADELDGE